MASPKRYLFPRYDSEFSTSRLPPEFAASRKDGASVTTLREWVRWEARSMWLVGQVGSSFDVEIDDDAKVSKQKELIWKKKPNRLKEVDADALQLFLAKPDGEWLASNGSAVLQMRTGDIPAQIKGMLTKEIDPDAQIGAVFEEVPQYDPIHVLVRKDGDMVELQNSLEWRQPNPLCNTFGKAWPYQGREKIAATVAGPLVDHFNAWKDGNDDKQTHAINLVLSGPGTGKSRMLDEMDGILLRAAELSGSQEMGQQHTDR
ncbi:hypothetical protein ON010_g15301 [Phytophthora cinnamomi]|nr:hypothetical protein ON010_g15301 [Phytophthora cinnamomi]